MTDQQRIDQLEARTAELEAETRKLAQRLDLAADLMRPLLDQQAKPPFEPKRRRPPSARKQHARRLPL